MTYRVGYFVGSLSSTSINRILAKALIRLAPDDLEFTEIAIRDLPLINYVGPDGKFTDEAPEFVRGRWVKDCDKDIIRDLKSRGLLFHQEQYDIVLV